MIFWKNKLLVWNRQLKIGITTFFQNNKIIIFPGSGESRCLEAVGEDDELFVEKSASSSDVVEKPPSGRRKHSLPQQLDTNVVKQVSESLIFS